jgi:hypothetical protein
VEWSNWQELALGDAVSRRICRGVTLEALRWSGVHHNMSLFRCILGGQWWFALGIGIHTYGMRLYLGGWQLAVRWPWWGAYLDWKYRREAG